MKRTGETSPLFQVLSCSSKEPTARLRPIFLVEYNLNEPQRLI